MILVLTPDRDSRGKNDYDGAFEPEARAFVEAHGATWVRIDMSRPVPDRLRQMIAAIEYHQPEVVVWFGHGLPGSIPQVGLDTDEEIARFTGAIAANATSPLVVFYACSMAFGGMGGDGQLCDRIRDSLVKHGARGAIVIGHTRSGHTTWNPYVRRYQGPEAKPHNVGGRWQVVPPGEPGHERARWTAWRRALRGPYRFRFIFDTPEQTATFLEAA